MAFKATLVDLDDIRLVVCRAEEFPAGIKDAWDRLESKLASLKGRKFYGLTFFDGKIFDYYAGLVPINEDEITSLGFPTMLVKGGKYARVRLLDWQKNADRIGEIFGELIESYPKDPAGPTIEFYRSQSELHLLIPLVEDRT